MSTLKKIKETLITEFSAAVDAVDKLHVATIDDISGMLGDASQDRAKAMAEVRRKREEAAEIIAESLRDEERCEAAFRNASQLVNEELAKLRGSKTVAPPSKLKAISGGRNQDNA
jgi:glutamyl-tRNA reductase